MTITTASEPSGLWTFDHTATKLPISIQVTTQTTRKASPNYRPPFVEDCPSEPDVDPSKLLPKDSAVVLTEVSTASTEDDMELEPSDGNSSPSSKSRVGASPATRIPADTAPRTSSFTGKDLLIPTGTQKATSMPKMPSIKDTITTAGNLAKLDELRLSHPLVLSAYDELLKVICENADADSGRSLQQTLGADLQARALWNLDEPSSGNTRTASRPVTGPGSGERW